MVICPGLSFSVGIDKVMVLSMEGIITSQGPVCIVKWAVLGDTLTNYEDTLQNFYNRYEAFFEANRIVEKWGFLSKEPA